MNTAQPSRPAGEAPAAQVPAAPRRAMMQAIMQHRYGTAPEDALRLEQTAVPAIAADEVLVQVRAARVDQGT